MSTIELALDVTDEIIEDIIEGAGYVIGYWASEGQYDSEARTYSVTDAEDDATYHVTYDDIAKAIGKIVRNEIELRDDIREAIVLDLIDYDNGGRMDSEVYDCVIQVACLGSITYG